MECTTKDIAEFCRRLEIGETRMAGKAENISDRFFGLGMASAYKHIAELIESCDTKEGS